MPNELSAGPRQPGVNGTMPGDLFRTILPGGDAARAARPALRCGEVGLTYAELEREVESVARLVLGAGVAPGDRVALVLRNSIEYVVAFFGVTAAGAVAVPVDPLAGPERLRHVTGDTDPRACLHHSGTAPPLDGPVPLALAVDAASREVRAEGPRAAGPLPEPAADAPAAILFSAGSTGRPKGVVLRHRHLVATARILAAYVRLGPDHRELVLAPLTHSGGWQRVSATLLSGGRAVIASGPFSVTGLLEDLAEHAINGFFATPPVLRVLLRTPEARVREAARTLVSIESASAPLGAAELARLLELLPGVRVLFQYGLTECSRALILDARARPDKLHTVGLPTPGARVAIRAEDGRQLGPGEEGEVLLAAAQRTCGYWRLPALDAERFEGPWLRTGDFGRLDDDGFLTLLGRRDDVINCGGHSFFPLEVETELGTVPGVRDYLVAGVPDPQGLLGQVAWAFVVPDDAAAWTPGDLLGLAKRRLPPHMVPRRVVVVPALAVTGTGKPSRRATVERYGPPTTSARA